MGEEASKIDRYSSFDDSSRKMNPRREGHLDGEKREEKKRV